MKIVNDFIQKLSNQTFFFYFLVKTENLADNLVKGGVLNRISAYESAKTDVTKQQSLTTQYAINLAKNERNCSITGNCNNHA